MKKYIALLLSLILLTFCFGCSSDNRKDEDAERVDYVINDTQTIKIGVIAPKDNEIGNHIIEGVKFANEMASKVNIDKGYQIELSVADINDDISLNANNMIEEKVAAVICFGTDYDKTNLLIDSFKSTNTPLLFTDNNSNKILDNSTSYSITTSATYQASVLAAYMQGENLKNGSIIYENNDYCKELSDSYTSLFKDNYGITASTYEFNNDLNLSTLTSGTDFVFVIGNNIFSQNTAKSIKEQNAQIPVILTEMYRNESFENTIYDGCYYLSKFESDSNNHYVTDFMSVYSNTKDVAVSDISSAIAYGYDAYMLIYGALGSLNPNSNSSPLNSVKNDSSADTTNVSITTSQINEAMKKEGKVYEGVIDSISFEENGTFKASYIFINSVKNGSPYMINKFVY